jgi:enoyl-CoA hydratase
MNFETIELSTQDHIATLTLNRPESKNALNLKMCLELTQACHLLNDDPGVHVVIINARGNVFCAGADLKERPQMNDQEIVARRVAGFTAYASIEALQMPVICVVQGAAFGSGCEIAAASDWIIASHAAKFKYPEVGWGTVGATQRLPRIVGRRMAKELLFTSRTFDAQEALSLGLVNHVYEEQDLIPQAQALAEHIGQCNPLTVRLTKRCIDQGLETTREGAMAVELLAIQENLQKTDWKAAISKFSGNQKS